LGIAVLAGGAEATVRGAVELARIWGWSERLIGLTIVSAGTGLPEVVASVYSSIRGRSDIALGNVIGSNLFNVLIVLGLSSCFGALPVSEGLLTTDAWWMLGLTVGLIPMLWLRGRIGRAESVILLLAYAAYLTLLLRQPGE